MRNDYELDKEDIEDVIDEEELVMLREQKDLKREYRDMFSSLKTNKEKSHDAQSQIDIHKEKLLISFEKWYEKNFEKGTADQ
jgi:hypothetical protein